MKTTLATPKFEESMRRSFVEACQAPKSDGTFQRYANHFRGSIVKGCVEPVLKEIGHAREDTLAAGLADAEMRGEARLAQLAATSADEENEDVVEVDDEHPESGSEDEGEDGEECD